MEMENKFLVPTNKWFGFLADLLNIDAKELRERYSTTRVSFKNPKIRQSKGMHYSMFDGKGGKSKGYIVYLTEDEMDSLEVWTNLFDQDLRDITVTLTNNKDVVVKALFHKNHHMFYDRNYK